MPTPTCDTARLSVRETAQDTVLKFLERFDTGSIEDMITLLDSGATMDPCNTLIYGKVFRERLQGVEDIRATLREVVSRYKTDHIVTNMRTELYGWTNGAVANVKGKFEGRSWNLQSEDMDELGPSTTYSHAGGNVSFQLVHHGALGWQIQYCQIVTLYSNMVQNTNFTMEYQIP